MRRRKTQWIAALLLAGSLGWTLTAMAGPGVGPYGPWNTGGAFGGFGPYQPYVAEGYDVNQGLGNAYYSGGETPVAWESRGTVVRERPCGVTRTSWVAERTGVVDEGPPVRRVRDVTFVNGEAVPVTSARVEVVQRPEIVAEESVATFDSGRRCHHPRAERAGRRHRQAALRRHGRILNPVGERTVQRTAAVESVGERMIVGPPSMHFPPGPNENAQRVGPPYPNADLDYNNPYR